VIAASLLHRAADKEAERLFVAQLRSPPGKRFQSQRLENLLVAQTVKSTLPQINATALAHSLVLFNGQLHNASELAEQLQIGTKEPATVYSAALDRWGNKADEYCIGNYVTIAATPGRTALRLARSPFQAPPLHFRHDGHAAMAGSIARSLFWREDRRPEPDLERVAQTLLNDHSDRHRSWYKDVYRLPLGSAIELSADNWREIWRYDLFARPQIRLGRSEDYVEAALSLFDRGVEAVLGDATKPAIMLSGGLDSAMVAASALKVLPESIDLKAYTFGPESGWNAAPPRGAFLSDFPAVRAFAQANPRIALTCETNHGKDLRYRMREMVEAADGAPAMAGTAWIEHALFEAAAEAGCDVMLCGTMGNLGFSSAAPWAYAEFLRTGRWIALHRALASRRADHRSLWRRLLGLGISPLLPDPVWSMLQKLKEPGGRQEVMPPALSAGWPGYAAARRRASGAGANPERMVPASKREYWCAILAEDGQDQGLYAQAMELIHGLPLRDPTAYRPLLEFCWGCPTDVFLRDGTDRWLAREMARGRLPEAQRTNRDYGRQFVDVSDRVARVSGELGEELERMGDDPDIAAMIDLAGLAALVRGARPTGAAYDHAKALPLMGTLPLGIAAARFIAYAKGRNDI
jgi:asparagine synthase (glutamine-hydrolysing)